MSAHSESVILVEGFDDRDFWKGLLSRAGCREARKEPPANHRESPAFTYLTRSDALLHVVPYRAPRHGGPQKPELADVAKLKLKARANKPMKRLVLSPDADGYVTLEDARKSVRALLDAECPGAIETPEGDFVVDDGQLVVSTLFVHADVARDGEGRMPRGVPEQRALEQLACAAVCRVHPERGAAVAAWLSGRPGPLGKDHKAHAWSFYAGWWTDHGTGDFYGSLWRDDLVAAELERLLRAQGAWRVIELLVT